MTLDSVETISKTELLSDEIISAADSLDSVTTDTVLEIPRKLGSLDSFDTAISKKKARPILLNLSARKLSDTIVPLKRLFHFKPAIWLKRHFVKIVLLVISCVIIMFTILYYRDGREHSRFMTTTRLSIMDKEVQRACRYIERNHQDSNLSTAAICESVITGEAFLEAIFQRDLGLSVKDFIDQVRVNHVKIILDKNFDTGNTELCLSAGFKEEKDLLMTFSRITGTDLEKYRSAIQNHQPAHQV